jgi:hypothetical protein
MMTILRRHYFLLSVMLLLSFSNNHSQVFSFAPIHQNNMMKRSSERCNTYPQQQLFMGVQTLDPDDAAMMGIRDWPQQSKQGQWSESCAEGQTLTRYILDGEGTVLINDEGSPQTVGPGTLVEVEGPSNLSWQSATPEMIILTPGFEEGGKLLAVAGVLVLVCGALLAGFGS